MKNIKKGLIFNIQRFSLNDGEGIRTIVFFKGCPLLCPWCSNPESQSFKIEYMRDKLNSGKFRKIGKYYSVDELLKEVLKDEIFFNTSGGGVTLSGGEILSQPKFVIEFLKKLKENDINTAIETCGIGNTKLLKKILEKTDTVLFDLKIMNNDKSKEVIGVNSSLIIKNFEVACKNNYVIPRIPFIPGYTDSIQNIDEILKIVLKNNIKEIHILPYHNYGVSKYELLDRIYKLSDTKLPSKKRILEIKTYIESKGLNVIIGG
ncbi:glycyl-radical enzyme activating protein [Streptobacillus ratti]|uniref:glycyl-radical enzyme activating protein n=1 Tax=Streptobacillus ratti TaxID=1720557 RepID=UPI000AAAA038|nr:glycyl-radical enzyme activating protein [Streptobacillus ratti]